MAATAGTQRAQHTIIFVPGLGRDAQNTGEAITSSIRASADVRGGRFVVETPAPAPEGLRATGAIVSGSGKRLVDIYELDYRRTFERLDRDDKGDEQPPGIASAIYSALLAVWLWIKAVRRRQGRPTKSLRARAHLFIGLVVAAILVVVAVVMTYEVGAALINRAFGTDLPLTPEPDAVLWAGLITGAGYLAARKNLLRAAAQARRVLRYYDEPVVRQRMSVEVARAIDDLLDEGYEGKIHLLAYSFGSSVVLDALLCYSGEQQIHERVGHPQVSTLVTVGCPYDAERVFFPDRLAGRAATNPQLQWRNLFVASDLFGSNFRGKKDGEEGLPNGRAQTSADHPDNPTGPGGLDVTSIRYLPDEELTFWSFLRLAAFRHHNDYWHEEGGCWAPVLDLWGLTDPLTPPHAGPGAGGATAAGGSPSDNGGGPGIPMEGLDVKGLGKKIEESHSMPADDSAQATAASPGEAAPARAAAGQPTERDASESNP